MSEVFPATPADGTILLDDVVLRFDGVNVQDNRHLIELINRTKLGVAIPLVVFRKQGFVNVSTKLGDLDAVLAK